MNSAFMGSSSIFVIVLLLILVASLRAFVKGSGGIDPGLAAATSSTGKSDAEKTKEKVGVESRILRTVLGFMVCFFTVALFAGVDAGELLQAVILIVVCTAGFAGVVMAVFSYIVGTVLVFIFRLAFAPLFKGVVAPYSMLVRTDNISDALQDYASKAKLAGMSDRDIKDNLLLAGWSGNVIDLALKEPKEDSRIEY